MASANTLCKKLLNVKTAVIEGHDFFTDQHGVNHIRIKARPNKWHEDDCPFCHKRCKRYDHQLRAPRTWRALDWGGTLVEVVGYTHRINCPKHGVIVADVPWACPESRFTKDFDLTVGWLAVYLPRSTVSEYMRIDWETVGRCVDPFHVVEWAMEALDEVRREVWREAYDEAVQLAKANPRKPGRPRADNPESQKVAAAKAKAEGIKNAAYALGKAPEHLTDLQQMKLAMIAESSKRLYRAYRMKEMLRLLLKIKDPAEAEVELNRWLWWASHSRIDAFKELYKKIKRHKKHILNTIRLGLSNARIEATNNKIKLIIRKVYGFRNIQNMLDMVYLVCSDLKVPLPNRKPKIPQSA